MLCSGLLAVQCTDQATQQDIVAKAGDQILYKSDIVHLIPKGISSADSTAWVKDYRDRWARRILLEDAAEMNLSEDQRINLDELVERYRQDLYLKSYLEQVVAVQLDTLVEEGKAQEFYQKNRSYFKTDSRLVRLRYMKIDSDHPKLAEIKTKFANYNAKRDAAFWDKYQLQLREISLRDSIWVPVTTVYPHLPFLTKENESSYMSKGNCFSQTIDDKLYYGCVIDVIDANQNAPYEYASEMVKEIIKNQRKLELVQQFEKDLIEDAIKYKRYEVYQ